MWKYISVALFLYIKYYKPTRFLRRLKYGKHNAYGKCVIYSLKYEINNLNLKKINQVEFIEQYLPNKYLFSYYSMVKGIFYAHLINPHQIYLQILRLPYLSSQHLHHHYHHFYPDLHPLNILLIQIVEELLGYNQVFLHPEVLNFLPIYFPLVLSVSRKPCLFSWERLDSSIFVCTSQGQNFFKQGGSKLLFMSFEIVSLCVRLWYFFQKHVVLQLIHIYINSTC